MHGRKSTVDTDISVAYWLGTDKGKINIIGHWLFWLAAEQSAPSRGGARGEFGGL